MTELITNTKCLENYFTTYFVTCDIVRGGNLIDKSPNLTWSQFLNEIKELERISNSIKQYMYVGWQKLTQVFGIDWPSSAYDEKHPWIATMFNKAPWVKAYFSRIGHQILNIEDYVNFEKILTRLMNPKECFSAKAELDVAWKLLKGGVDFKFLEPTQSQKSCDIIAKVDRKDVAIEVTTFLQSQKSKIQLEIFMSISHILMQSDVIAGGKILRMLSKPHAKYLMEQIREGVDKAIQDDCLVLIDFEDIAEFCIAPKHMKKLVDDWKLDRDMRPDTQLFGPDFDISEGRRLHSKIMKKCHQIPETSPGVLYIEGAPIHIIGKDNEIMLRFSTADIEEAVYENPNLLFVTLNKHSLGWGTNYYHVDSGIYISKRVQFNLLEDITMIVANRFYKYQPIRHKKLIKAFWKVSLL